MRFNQTCNNRQLKKIILIQTARDIMIASYLYLLLNPNLSNSLFYHTYLTGKMDWELPDKVGALRNAGLEDSSSGNRSQWSTETASSCDSFKYSKQEV